jgi:hypothetical protein
MTQTRGKGKELSRERRLIQFTRCIEVKKKRGSMEEGLARQVKEPR